MPAKWQQWMPFRIDAFKGSPAVQAMHPCARIGYLYLLACAWQTEDCTVSSDQLELAEQSGLGDELWAVHGPRILRKFEPVNGNGRLRNDVCFEEWERAKKAYQSRAYAAQKTNSTRSASENHTVTVENSDGHRAPTVYGRVYVPVDVPVSTEETESLPEKPIDASMLATAVLTECRIGGRDLRMVLEEVGRAEASHGEDLETITEQMIKSWADYCAAKPTLEYAWGATKFFGEGYWKRSETWPRIGKKASGRDQRRKEFMEATID